MNHGATEITEGEKGEKNSVSSLQSVRGRNPLVSAGADQISVITKLSGSVVHEAPELIKELGGCLPGTISGPLIGFKS